MKHRCLRAFMAAMVDEGASEAAAVFALISPAFSRGQVPILALCSLVGRGVSPYNWFGGLMAGGRTVLRVHFAELSGDSRQQIIADGSGDWHWSKSADLSGTI